MVLSQYSKALFRESEVLSSIILRDPKSYIHSRFPSQQFQSKSYYATLRLPRIYSTPHLRNEELSQIMHFLTSESIENFSMH